MVYLVLFQATFLFPFIFHSHFNISTPTSYGLVGRSSHTLYHHIFPSSAAFFVKSCLPSILILSSNGNICVYWSFRCIRYNTVFSRTNENFFFRTVPNIALSFLFFLTLRHFSTIYLLYSCHLSPSPHFKSFYTSFILVLKT